jgi:glycosyltransferase involved in cell wall biosynthesis
MSNSLNSRQKFNPQYPVGIDGFSLARKDSGIEVYTRELVNGLLEENCKIELYNYTNFEFRQHRNLTKKISGYDPGISTLKKLKWELNDINELISADIQLFHCPHFILPFKNKAAKKVVTVHDLAFLRHPEFFDWKTKLYYRLFLKRSLSEADAIICISQSCLDDLLYYFPFVRNKVFKVHHGFKNFSAIEQDSSILKALDVKSPYILMIGTLNPRKNLQNAIAAFEKSSAKKDLELVIIGNLNEYSTLIAKQNPKIKFTGFISDEKLSALYKHASALLYPSYYEGFGFPVLEAMSAGLPVVTASNSSLPEISGYESVFLCNPASVNDISEKIDVMLTDANRPALVKHGFENVKRFSWHKMITDTLKVYDQV